MTRVKAVGLLEVRLPFNQQEFALMESFNQEMINNLMINRSKLMGQVDFYGPLRITITEAENMMKLVKSSDIASLKKVAKVTPEYEFYSELILTCLDMGPMKKINPDGTSVISYWHTLKKLLFNNFLKIIKNFQFEFIDERIFYNLSALIESNPRYNA